MISAFSFVKEVSTLTTAATVEGIFGALYFGFGRGLGGLLGGFSLSKLGNSMTFVCFAAGALVCALIYASVVAIARFRQFFTKVRSMSTLSSQA